MSTPRTLSLERERVRLHVEVHGEDTGRVPLVLTHGFEASSAMWRPNLGVLAQTRRVVTWDMRGHGRTVAADASVSYDHESAVADIEAILDACGIRTAAIGGLSLGGYLSLAFYRTHPDRVASLLLFDTGPGFKNEEARKRWNAYAISRAEAFESLGLGALTDSPEVRAADHDPVGLARAARGLLTQSDNAVITMLEKITAPTLVVVGAEDRPFLAAADYMASKIPGAHKVVLSRAGHSCNIDQPDAFNTAVGDFLNRLAN
jgi:pimeloyl-ACP methyl ester carboxylesterase